PAVIAQISDVGYRRLLGAAGGAHRRTGGDAASGRDVQADVAGGEQTRRLDGGRAGEADLFVVADGIAVEAVGAAGGGAVDDHASPACQSELAGAVAADGGVADVEAGTVDQDA